MKGYPKPAIHCVPIHTLVRGAVGPLEGGFTGCSGFEVPSLVRGIIAEPEVEAYWAIVTRTAREGHDSAKMGSRTETHLRPSRSWTANKSLVKVCGWRRHWRLKPRGACRRITMFDMKDGDCYWTLLKEKIFSSTAGSGQLVLVMWYTVKCMSSLLNVYLDDP